MGLTSLNDLFNDIDKKISRFEMVAIDTLLPFKEHPFKLYSGERMENLVQSIKLRGILQPLIVRNIDSGYEILSGHNRWQAAMKCGFNEVPVIIYTGLTDIQAMIIVTETNLMQRSFSELSISEKAYVLGVHYMVLQHDDKSIELIKEIDSKLLNVDNKVSPVETESYRSLGKRYDLDKNSVARYLRINKLDKYFKDLLDEEKLSIRAAVQLSFLKQDEIEMLKAILKEKEYHISIQSAEKLHTYSDEGKLSSELIYNILGGVNSTKSKSFKIGNHVLEKYFSPDQSAKEIEEIIADALEKYFAKE